MIEGTTKSGFKFNIDDAVLDDWEILETVDEIENNPQRIVHLAKVILGAEQYAELKKECTVDGRVSTIKMNDAITEILNTKN